MVGVVGDDRVQVEGSFVGWTLIQEGRERRRGLVLVVFEELGVIDSDSLQQFLQTTHSLNIVRL